MVDKRGFIVMKCLKRVTSVLFYKIILVGFIFLIAGCDSSPRQKNPEFISQLPGKIVFAKREGEVLAIYRSEIDGSNVVKLFKNNDPVNANASNPEWTKDGNRIEFLAMKNGEWTKWQMNADGSNPHVISGEMNFLSRLSKETDIDVDEGSIKIKGDFEYIYKHRNFDHKFNSGAREVAWGPDKETIIFEASGSIYIAKRDGSAMAEVVKGRDVDWWY